MAIDLHTLNLRLEAQSNRLQRDLDIANRKIRRFERATGKIAKSIKGKFTGLFAGLAAGGFVLATKRALDYADAIQQAGDKSGFTYKRLQELRFAASQNDISFRELEAGLGRFGKRLGLAQAGTGAAALAFRRLGIDLKKSQEEIFEDVVNIIGNVDDKAKQLALTTQFFGDDAQRLAVIFSQGTDALDDFATRAAELGIIISDDLIQNASDANDQFDILSTVLSVQFTKAMTTLAPTITAVGQAFADAAPAINRFFESIGIGDKTSLTIEQLERDAERLQERYSEIQQKLNRRIELNEFGNQGKIGLAGGISPADLVLPSKADLELRRELIKQEFIKTINAIEELLLRKNDEPGGEPGNLPDWKKYFIDQQQAEREARESNERRKKREKEERDALREKQKAEAALQRARNEARTLLQANDPGSEYREQIVEIQRLRDAMTDIYPDIADGLAELELDVNEKWDSMKTAGEKAAEETAEAWQDLGPVFSSAFEDAIVQGEELSDVLKGLEQDIIRVATRIAVTEPLNNFFAGAIKGFAGSDFIQNLFPKRAFGGPVFSGRGYLVGERGPELFVSPSNGTIVPNDRLMSASVAGGGGGVTVNVVNNAPGVQATANERQEGGTRVIDVVVDRVKTAIATDIARGNGSIPAAMSNTYGLSRVAGSY